MDGLAGAIKISVRSVINIALHGRCVFVTVALALCFVTVAWALCFVTVAWALCFVTVH